jgi:hypothetical protein
MDDFNICWKNLLDIGREKLSTALNSEKQKKELNKALLLDMFFKYEPVDEENKVIIPLDSFYSCVYYNFMEIYQIYENLQNIVKYVSYFPRTTSQPEKVNYLRFLIGAYLNEVYRLEERLKMFIKKVNRKHKNDSRYPMINKLSKNMIQLVENSMENIKKIRHNHVHERRFNDKDIERAESVIVYEEMIEEIKEILPKMIIPSFKKDFKKARENWKRIFVKNNSDIKNLLDSLFLEINKIIFTEDGKLIYPEKL